MAETPLRWECRIWRDAVAALPEGPVEERTDVYLIHPMLPGVMAKLREGRLEVKELAAIHDGLQLWCPRPALDFPLARDLTAEALHLGEAARRVLPECTTCGEELVAAVERTTLNAVPVAKQRVELEHQTCRAEAVNVRFNGLETSCEALEHEEPEVLLAAVRAHGWEPRDNESYLQRILRGAGLHRPVAVSRRRSSRSRP